MSKKKIGLIDYGMGNLNSVSKALQAVGAEVQWVESPSQLDSCDAVVLPGVGAFNVAVRNLKSQGLFDPLRNWISAGKPFLGICLGYQLLFTRGEEGGKKEKGLDIYNGSVRRFPHKKNLKVPHMGWNRVDMQRGGGKRADVFQGLGKEPRFYFVHSYFPEPTDKKIVATTTDYGLTFASSISDGQLFACQFHPEKSGDNGLRLLKNFVRGVN